VKRTKPPVLTSPWKIGFLVSLMLVFVSIGVAYFFTRRFGISWNLLERDWLNPNEWLGVLRGEGFLFEVLPLVGLVAVASMVAYVIITGAVRKYKRYLDSGCDYRNLLASLKDLDNLEDKRKIERIRNHPELKRLLLGLADTFEEKERLLSEREGAFETRLQDAVQAKETELAESFSQECERLAKAVEGGGLEPSAIEFSNPGLRRLSEIMARPTQGAEQPSSAGLEESYGDLRKTSDVVHARLCEIAAELRTSCEGAQEIEARLKGLTALDRAGAGDSGLDEARDEIKRVVASLSAIEQVNSTIDSLSEEAKGVAINTALHAGSGMGTQDDLIRLAEEVKEVATRFKDAARRFAQTSSAVRSSVEVLESVAGGPSGHRGRQGDPEENIANVLSRVSLWVERIVVLADKVSNLGKSYDVSVSSLRETSREATTDTLDTEGPWVEEPAEKEQFGFESLERSRSLFGDEGESSPEEPDVAPRADQRIFEEIPSDAARPLDAPDTEPEEAEAAVPEPEEPAAETAPAPASAAPVEVDESTESPAPAETGPEERSEYESEVDEAVDLYALGAVDYDPALHG
jgi:hypothetical protein